MALLRCPVCSARGEVVGDDPSCRLRCSACGNTFLAGEADPTREYNILAEDSPPFLAAEAHELGEWPVPPRWRGWVGRLAAHCGMEPGESVRRALTEFARKSDFPEPPPSD